MPIGIVSDGDLESELENNKSVIVDLPAKGRGPQKEVPTGLRKIIGDTAIKDGNDSAKELAREFGLSDSSVSAYKKGATSTTTYNEPDKNLVGHIRKTKSRVAKSAYKTLRTALKHITEDKLAVAKVQTLSGVAKDMSLIIKNMEPEQEGNDDGVKFVFFAPPMKEEKSFEVIDVVE